jgi:hypothetical protein
MFRERMFRLIAPLGAVLVLALGVPARAIADDNDPPTRAARLAYAEGSVSFQPGGTEDWMSAVLNRPLTTGDRVWSGGDGRLEMQLDGSLLRLSNNTAVSFLNLSDHVTQVQLSSGSLLVRVRRLDENDTYEVDTPNLAFSILRPGLYRLTVDDAGGATAIKVRDGAGEATGGGASYPLGANENDVFSGTDQLAEYTQQEGVPEDPFDAWSTSRDRRWERAVSARYVSPDVVGYEDLDDHGDWRAAPGYGNVWFPRATHRDWAPYHDGHWAYVEPWGYTWVDDQPWGFAPFHYGRWVSVNGSWGWVPAPPRVEGVAYTRPVYAPALVAWVGVGAGVAWFALGPRDVYVPSYPVSREYVNNVNVSNTTVNTTVVNNYYNNVVVNKTVNVTNVTYVNQRVPGAIVATSTQAFSTAQPVARNVVRVDARTVASAPVRAFTPAIVPAKQAVLGSGHVAAAKPPAAIQARAVVAKVAPPPPPPAFEKRQAAIKSNGGKPLSAAEVRKIEPAAQQHTAAVKIAPPAKPGKPVAGPAPKVPASANKPQPSPAEPNKPQTEGKKPPASSVANKAAEPAVKPAPPKNAAPPQAHPPEKRPEEAAAVKAPVSPTKPLAAEPRKPAEPEAKKPGAPAAAGKPAEPAVKPAPPKNAAPPQPHPTEKRPAEAAGGHKPAAAAPPAEKPPSAKSSPASTVNPQLEQKHQQEQADLRAKQEQERQKVQAQQQAERQKAQQQADEAKKQQLEKQHQQQTQQLQQKHEQEQQQLQQKQQQEKQQHAGKAPPKKPADQPSSKETP